MTIKSLTLRIWLIITVIIVSIVLVISLAFTFIINNNDEDNSRHTLRLAHQIALYSIKGKNFNEILIGFGKYDGQHIIIDKTSGQATFYSGEKINSSSSLLLELNKLLSNNSYRQSLKETINNQTYFIEISQVKEKIFLISYQTLNNTQNLFEIFIIAFLLILLSLPLSKVIAYNIAQPLKLIEDFAQQIANKEWESELDLKREDEIGRLVKAMKGMKEALKIADEEEKKFLQSISHDLKTPVMVIMSYAQAIIDGIYEDSPEESAAIIKNEAVRLEKKIKQILYLNTLDYVLDNDKDKEEVYLNKLLVYLVANFRAMRTDLTWNLNIETEFAVISGNLDRIRVSIENVLENQLRHAEHMILVSLKDAGSCWMIEIMNDGPLISEKDLNRIFNYLHKGDRGNFGLGLSISHKILQYYDGDIKVEIRDGQVCFTLCYPKMEYLPEGLGGND